jgi:deazaflavin-dependent oxidoreductase (nitroreductase family)
VARFNRVVTNRIQGTYAWLVPPWAVVIHQGRRSGRTYRTPVVAFRRGERIVIAVLYGEESDWVRNVLAAGGGEIERLGRRRVLGNPRLVESVGTGEASPAGRLLTGLAGKALVADLGRTVPRG